MAESTIVSNTSATSNLGPSTSPPSFRDPQPTAQIHIHELGQTPQTFTTYKNFLCHYSQGFNAVLNGKLTEAQIDEITIEGTSKEVFGYFQNWLYTQKFADEITKLRTYIKVDLWLFGHRIIAPKLQNDVMDVLWDCRLTRKFTVRMLRQIYENTCKGSPLRRFAVDTWLDRNFRDKDSDKYPNDFLVGLLSSKAKGPVGPLPVVQLYYVDEQVLSGQSGSSDTLAAGDSSARASFGTQVNSKNGSECCTRCGKTNCWRVTAE